MLEVSITEGEKQSDTEPAADLLGGGGRGKVGYSRNQSVGVGSFSGFTYKSLLCPVGPGHAVSHLVDR